MFIGMGNTAEAAKLDMRQQMDYFKKKQPLKIIFCIPIFWMKILRLFINLIPKVCWSIIQAFYLYRV